MFEVIGIITVSLIVVFLLVIQYLMTSVDDYKVFKNYFIKLFPLLPFIVMFLLTIYYILEIMYYIFKNMYYIFKKWFEINCGWFFINGRKRDEWAKYLRNKYE